jgi:U3 small nucleolar ribonucleoprotein protein IMP3
MRELKFHEKKLLKKTDYYDWKSVSSLKKAGVVRKYRLGSRKDYNFYN